MSWREDLRRYCMTFLTFDGLADDSSLKMLLVSTNTTGRRRRFSQDTLRGCGREKVVRGGIENTVTRIACFRRLGIVRGIDVATGLHAAHVCDAPARVSSTVAGLTLCE